MKEKLKLAWCISIIFYVINLFGDSYYYMIAEIPLLTTVFDFLNSALGSMYLFRGWIFVMLGFSLAVHKERKHFWGSFCIFILFGILNNTELALIKNLGIGLQYSVTVLKPITSVMMCYWLTFDKFSIKGNTSYFARLSTVLYFLHIFFRELLYNCIIDMHVVYCIILLFCMTTTILMDALSKIKHLSWVKKIF